MSTKLEKEIKSYRILACMSVRATGSTHGQHSHRCLWDLCGKPLIQWTLETVTPCKYIDKIVVCTEDRKIKDVVEKLGVQVIDRPLFQARPFPRDYSKGLFKRFNPRSMTAQAPSVYTETTSYALHWLEEEENWVPDIYIDFVANQPMGTVGIVNRIIETFFKDEEATEVRTFYHAHYYAYMFNPITNRMTPLFNVDHDRQLLPKLFSLGNYHLFGHPLRAESPGSRMAAVYITAEEGLDIHAEEDLFLARCYMKRRLERQEEKVTKKSKRRSR